MARFIGSLAAQNPRLILTSFDLKAVPIGIHPLQAINEVGEMTFTIVIQHLDRHEAGCGRHADDPPVSRSCRNNPCNMRPMPVVIV